MIVPTTPAASPCRGVYAREFGVELPSGAASKAKVVLQLRIRPGSYGVGQETVGASGAIDPHVSNDSIEWYTKGDELGSVCITGVLVKLLS